MFLSAVGFAQAPVHPPVDAETLLHLARERLRHGDYHGVRILTDQAVSLPGDHQRNAQYLTAMAYEFEGQLDEALALYDALISAYAVGSVPDDLWFRRAECRTSAGLVKAARADLDHLAVAGRPALDKLKIEVLDGLLDLRTGKDRRGIRRLEAVLDRIDGSVGQYYQAVGHHAILDHAITEASQLTFVGSDRRKRKNLEARAALIETGNQALAAIIPTEEAAVTLKGFLALGRAHRDIGQDLLDESPLDRLTPEQRDLNRSMLEDKVEGIWVKATLYYDRALQYAARMDFTGEPVATLYAEYAEIVARVDARQAQ